ncbi:mitochondrial ribosomal protein L44 [Calliopsis andreniformis]|uniref:mitochondrial ribosomal protein L44 n=1 Tax=Calliopsis andreniformis TaxID=337506 RepID=UPI003FCDAD88
MMNRLRLCLSNFTSIKNVNYEGHRYYKRWVAPTYRAITSRKKKLGPQPEPKRNSFIDWSREAELYAFNYRLSENFLTEKLNQAFIHKSYIFEEEKKQKEIGIEDPKLDIEHNQNLIDKGSEITSKAVYNYLRSSLPHAPESVILTFHDYLLSEEILAKASSHIGTKDIILTAEHPVAQETLAATFLALVGALAESSDIDRASTFVRDFLIVGLAEKDLSEIWNPPNPFGILDSIMGKENGSLIEARIIGHTGKNTILSAYHIGIYADKQFLSSGFGQSIEEAKNVAAMNALCKLFGIIDSNNPLRFDTKINMSNF